MRKIILFLALGASGFAASAIAQTTTPPPPPADAPMRGGPITRADYIAQAGVRFDRLDTNHDGTLDPAERAAGRPMRGMRGGGMPPAGAPEPRAD